MELHILSIVTFLSLMLVVSHADQSPEGYWNSVLPNTPMPNAIKDLLHPEWMEEKSTSVVVGKDDVDVDAGNGKPSGGTNVNVGHQGVGVQTGEQGKQTSVGVGKGGVAVSTGSKGKPVYVGVKPGPSPFLYKYAATDDQLQDNPNVALFFQEKDLKQGTKMNLHFTKSTNTATFLSRNVAESIPFLSSKLPNILEQFSVKPNSMEAKIMQQTIKECEEPGITGEDKYCATSLESMIDFSTSKLGKNVHAFSTTVSKESQLQKFTIIGVKKIASAEAVVCHKQNYAYAVFYCHKTHTTRSRLVSLIGANGIRAKAMVACHTDTSAWNPRHLAFEVLKVKPGTVPICHFLPEDHVVWVHN